MQTKLITYFNIKGGIYKTSMSIITAYELAKDKKYKDSIMGLRFTRKLNSICI
ncbi:hypothetical protein Q5M85_09545 [Paraclostridium bifermentans]|nr:hypothetical protein [Paraclostridium bifermentans]